MNRAADKATFLGEIMTSRPAVRGRALLAFNVFKRSIFLGLIGLLAISGAASADSRRSEGGSSSQSAFTITQAEWSSSSGSLRVQGTGSSGSTVTIANSGSGATLGTTSVRRGQWSARFANLSPVPCTVSARQSGSTTVLTRQVGGAPNNCGPTGADTTPPTATLSTTPAGPTYTTTQTITLNATASDNVGVTKVEFYDGNTLLGTDTSSPYSFAWAITSANNGSHSLMAKAYDAVGNIGTSSAVTRTVNIATADTTAPTAPTNLTATAAGSTQINLTWTASTDSVGVTGYQIWRCSGSTCTNFAQVGTSTTASFSNTGLTATTTYRYEVRATDAAGNLSGYSNIASATTQAGTDTTPPTVSALTTSPAGPTYTTAQTVTLSVTATDNVGVARVDFLDGTTVLGSDTTSPYSYAWAITSANNGTHSLTVRAVDAAGNVATTTTVSRTVSIAAAAVGVLPTPNVAAANYVVIGSNDLGMHCADQDYQIFSILPPFNVLHTQLIRKGTGTSASTLPSIINGSAADVYYAAASNASDPAGAGSINTGSAASVFKSNFWSQIAGTSPLQTQGTQSYRGLYPVLGGASSALDLFSPLNTDVGIPVPDPNDLPNIVPFQQAMPSVGSATPRNDPQQFKHYYTDLAFFNQPLTGISGAPRIGFNVAGLNVFAAEGVPILPVDDAGRSNAYPLLRVGATLKASANGPAVAPNSTGSNVVAALDIVVPVASEADCQSCHGATNDPALTALGYVSNGSATDFASVGFALARSTDASTPGADQRQKLLNAAKINILRLHDKKHGAAYKSWSSTTLTATACTTGAEASCLDQRRNIQCSQCHYTPALDLAQVGPIDEPAQGANGRQQRSHISMSRAMHGHHGDLVFNGSKLFPDMPAPGPSRTAATVNSVLENTCYHCHPGKQTKCMRGAMTAASASNPGGQSCQDCHGNMTHVGNDFSESFATTPGVATTGKRVPWRNEPKCQSCHIGDAVTAPTAVASLGGATNVIQRSQIQTQNGVANTQVDNIRLLRAYTNTAAAQPILANIQSATSRFAENQDLYRLSAAGPNDANKRGHGGIMCRACHGATHSEWPNQQPAANDNVAANQLQSHAGPVAECSTCHGSTNLGSSLNGPHGLHAIGTNSPWASSSVHEGPGRTFANCQPCHGGTSRSNSQGTVLSRATANKTIGGHAVAKGTPIGCQLCH